MDRTYWYKQQPSKPLHPELLWSRPENKQMAGKLLIIGGNQYGFAAPAEAYGASENASIGTSRVLLPSAVKNIAGSLLPGLEYAASTPSGSFSQAALGEFLDNAAWADGVLLAGDLGRNSETAVLLDNFISKHSGQITITKDAADYSVATPKLILERENTLLVITMAQLQKLATNTNFPIAFTLGMDLLRCVDGLHNLTEHYKVLIIVKHLDQLLVAVNGQVSSTSLVNDKQIWRVHTAATAAVWWLQNPAKPFEALSTAISEVL